MAEGKYKKIPQGTEAGQPGGGGGGHQVNFVPGVDRNKISKRQKILIGMAIALVLAIIIAILLIVLLSESAPVYPMGVASDNDLCTQIGAKALREGGGAVDAAISILLCLGAVQPQSNGIGGGGFMVVYTKDAQSAINFREMAPAASTQNMFVDDPDEAINGGMASGVPGEIMGYWTAHQRYGRLPWKDLFTPSVELLRTGIPVSAHMENALRSTKSYLSQDTYAQNVFFTNPADEDSYKKVGENFTNTMLADAYEAIGADGPDAFYKGSIGDNIIERLSETGGIMTKADLENYETVDEPPFEFKYRDYDIISAPPPASGHVVSLVLQLLQRFHIEDMEPLKAWNTILEAFRFGYAMRSQTGDQAFSNKTKWVVDKIRDGSWALQLEEKLVKNESGYIVPYTNVHRYSKEVYLNYDGTHTTHVSVLGPDGEAVACTSTVNLYFGSRVMTKDGIIMNNEMDDFSTPNVTNSFGYKPSPENFIVPGKRPLSSSSPSIVFDKMKAARFVTGAAGGSRIITGTLLSIINALDWKIPLDESLARARLHDQLGGTTLYEEYPALNLTVNSELINGLSSIGYNMTARDGYMSAVTSVSNLLGHTEASGDPRKEGTGAVVDQSEVELDVEQE